MPYNHLSAFSMNFTTYRVVGIFDPFPLKTATQLILRGQFVRKDSTDRDMRLALVRETSENLTRIDLSG